MDEAFVPPGWKRFVHNDRVVYSTPSDPSPVQIHSRAELSDHHRKGRFLEVKVDQLIFARKRKPKEKKYETRKKNPLSSVDTYLGRSLVETGPRNGENFQTSAGNNQESNSFPTTTCREAFDSREDNTVATSEDCQDFFEDCQDFFDNDDDQILVDDFDTCDVSSLPEDLVVDITNAETIKLEKEQAKLIEAVSKLTIDPSRQVDHKLVLEEAAKRLSDARLSQTITAKSLDLDIFKNLIKDCPTVEEMTKLIWMNPLFQKKFSHLFSSKLLEQLLSLGSLSENPLKSFPIDVNTNAYADIVHFALDHAEDVVLLLTNLTKKQENPISSQDVINLAYSFSSLAEAAGSRNNSLKKIKSICLRRSGLTNTGLDSLASVGVAETSRSYRNDRDLMASISEEILKQYAKKNIPQFTFDNLDIRINNITHHLTLNFLEFEQNDTSDLPTDSKGREAMLPFFSRDTLILTSVENKELFEHFQFVTAVTLGRLFGEEIEGLQWLLSTLPNHYNHPNSNTSTNKALLHVDKPMYLQETKNSDMFKIMESLQLEYLNLVAEQAEDKEKYFEDLKIILSVESGNDVREAAENRIKKEVLKAGELICHGDQLTNERFESCKRLKQGSTSAFERFEFMPIFRLGMFHLRMNKSIQDLECGMPTEVNVDDELSLGYFRTYLGLNQITNKADNIKRCGEFEKHDQFLLEVGKEILINAFKTFLPDNTASIVKTTAGAISLILRFLSESDIKYFYDPENFDEKVKFDDVLSACRDTAGRTVLALVADKVEHEGDGMGVRAVRKVMIPYFLNKKIAQTSKYAISLMSNLVNFMGASERTKQRIDLLATCNPTGGLGKSLARDQVNEHKVKLVKESVRGLHSQLTDSVLSKAVLGDNVLHQIQEHDEESMLLRFSGGRTSYRYIGEAERVKIRAEIEQVKPFDLNREKREYFEKTSGSVFSGLSLERVDKFLARNKVNFNRSYPHKNRK